MNCTDFELAVQDRLDKRQVELPDDLRAHAASCAMCQSFWQNQRRLHAATREWLHFELPSRLLEAVTRELSGDVQPDAVINVPRRVAGPAAGWVALCSTAALVLFVAVMIRIGPIANSPQQPVAQTNLMPTSPPAAVDDAQTPMIAGLLTGVRSEYMELSQSTSQALDEWSDLPRASDLIPNLSRPSASPTESSLSWPRIDRPVSDRVGQAFDFLWDALPQDASLSS